jgi:hypothetical protein
MTSFRQLYANRHNARKSTGPRTEEGKQQSRCNAVRHGLTAETVIGALEDAEDYQAFEQTIIADYDAQSAVERALVLRLASLLWRLRRATIMETGLFEIQASYMKDFREVRRAVPPSREAAYGPFRGADSARLNSDSNRNSRTNENSTDILATSKPDLMTSPIDPTVEIARCFLRLTNLPNFALDRLSRYEAMLWRQVGQTLLALNALDRCKPQERSRRCRAYFDFPELQK